MYYPIKVLEEALEGVYFTRELIRERMDDEVEDGEEIIKIDLHIEEMENAIKLLQGIKKTHITPHKYVEIFELYQSGSKIQELADANGVSYKTIQRILKKVDQYSKHGK